MGTYPIFSVVDDLLVTLRADPARAIVEAFVELRRPNAPAALAVAALAFPAVERDEIGVRAPSGREVASSNHLENAAQLVGFTEFRHLAHEAFAAEAFAVLERKFSRYPATARASNRDSVGHGNDYNGRSPRYACWSSVRTSE
jgi:hypothetical protein